MDLKNTKKTKMEKKFKSTRNFKNLINYNVENLKKRVIPKKSINFFLKKNIIKSKSSVNFEKKVKKKLFIEKIIKGRKFFKKKQSISTHNIKIISSKKNEQVFTKKKFSLTDINKQPRKKMRNKYSFKINKKSSLKGIKINCKKLNFKNLNKTSKFSKKKKIEFSKNTLKSEDLNKTSLDKINTLFCSNENYSKKNERKNKINNLTSLKSINSIKKSSEENFIKKITNKKQISNTIKNKSNSVIKNSSEKHQSKNSEKNLTNSDSKKSFDENFIKRINFDKNEILKNHYKIEKTDKELISDTLRHFRSISNQKSIKEIMNYNKKIKIQRNFKSMDREKKNVSFNYEKNNDFEGFGKLKNLTELRNNEILDNYKDDILRIDNLQNFQKVDLENCRNDKLENFRNINLNNFEKNNLEIYKKQNKYNEKVKFKIIKKKDIYINTKINKKKYLKNSSNKSKISEKKRKRKNNNNKVFFQSSITDNKSLFKSFTPKNVTSKNDSIKKKKKFKLEKKKSILTNNTEKICKCDNLKILSDFLKIQKKEKKNLIDITIKRFKNLQKKIEDSEKENKKLKEIIKKNLKKENFGEYIESIKKNKKKKILKDSFKKHRINVKKLTFKINNKNLFSSKGKKKNISNKFMNLFDKSNFSNLQNLRKSQKKRALKSFR